MPKIHASGMVTDAYSAVTVSAVAIEREALEIVEAVETVVRRGRKAGASSPGTGGSASSPTPKTKTSSSDSEPPPPAPTTESP